MNPAAPTLDQAIGAWQTSLEAAGRSPATIRLYIASVRELVKRCGSHADPAAITVEDMERIVIGWSVVGSTKRTRVCAWHQFYRWGARRYGWPNTAAQLELPRRNKPVFRRLTQSEVEAMLNADAPERSRLIVWLLAYTAIRVGELLRLRWGDVDLATGRVMIDDRAKGRKGRIVPLPDALVRFLAAVKEGRGEGRTSSDCYLVPRVWFGGAQRAEVTFWLSPATDRTIGPSIKATAAAAGVRDPHEITARWFRRFYLEHALESGMSIYVAAAIAGHSSIQTTAEYGGGASLGAVTRAVRELSFGLAPTNSSPSS